MLLTVPHRHNELFQPGGRLSSFFQVQSMPRLNDTPLFCRGEQGRVTFSLFTCFLEAVGLPFNILHPVGQFIYNCDQLLVGGGERGVVCNQFLRH